MRDSLFADLDVRGHGKTKMRKERQKVYVLRRRMDRAHMQGIGKRFVD